MIGVKNFKILKNNFLIQRNYFVNLKTIENTGFVDDKNFNNFLIQKILIQRNFSTQCFQVFKKILELNCIYNYIQFIFFIRYFKIYYYNKTGGKIR